MSTTSELSAKPTTRPRKYEPLLGPVATVFATVDTGSWRTVRPEVDFSSCVKCGVCRIHCPVGVVEIRKDEVECIVIEWSTCKGCGICASVCPKECIKMIEERSEDAG